MANFSTCNICSICSLALPIDISTRRPIAKSPSRLARTHVSHSPSASTLSPFFTRPMKISRPLSLVSKKCKKKTAQRPFLVGDRPLLGVPDWPRSPIDHTGFLTRHTYESAQFLGGLRFRSNFGGLWFTKTTKFQTVSVSGQILGGFVSCNRSIFGGFWFPVKFQADLNKNDQISAGNDFRPKISWFPLKSGFKKPWVF